MSKSKDECPFHQPWPDRCTKRGTVKLRSPNMYEGDSGMYITVCKDHEQVYRDAGWVDR